MNTFKGNWIELKGKMKQQWGKLTDDDFTRIEGNVDEVVGRIQQAYGYTKEKAISEFNAFKESTLNKMDQKADQLGRDTRDSAKNAAKHAAKHS